MFHTSYPVFGHGFQTSSAQRQQRPVYGSASSQYPFALSHGLTSDHNFGLASPSLVDPADEARQRLLVAMQEQKAARKAYADLVAERELARLEATSTFPALGGDSVDSFDSAYGTGLLHPIVSGPQYYNELALRSRQEELLRAQREELAVQQAVVRRQRELEAARQQRVAELRREKLEQVRQQKLAELREKKVAAAFQQLVQARRQQEAEHQLRQQLEARSRQQRAQEQRAAAKKQHEEAESIAEAIALAVAFAQQFFPETSQGNEVKVEPKPEARAVHFAEPPKTKVAPRQTGVHVSSAPSTSKAAPEAVKATPGPSTTSAIPVRVTIRDIKGKAPSHVRVNSVTSPTSTTTPADAIAALTILSSDLDAYLAPSHTWHSEAHRRHSLNQLLEQVDAVESGGEEAVRDIRRAIVRRVERALEGLPDVETPKAVGIKIREPVVERVEAADSTTTAAPAAVAAEPEVTGYDIPDFMEATTAVPETSQSSAAAPEPVEEPTVKSEWSTIDPAAPAPLALPLPKDELEEPVTAAELAAPEQEVGGLTNAPQLDLGEPEPVQPTLSVESSTATITAPTPTSNLDATPLDVVAGAIEVEASPSVTATKKQHALPERDGLSDWESTKAASDGEDAYEVL